MLYPVIDIGSNTVKLAVLDEENIFNQPPVFFKAVPLSLRTKIEENRLLSYAVEELGEVIKSYKEIAARLTNTPPIAFATASLRGLENMDEVLKVVKEKSGVAVSVISGEKEAFYSFLGATGSTNAKAGISVDLGGGSTELVAFRKNKILEAVSLPFGCLTLYHLFFEDGKKDWDGCANLVRTELKKSAPALTGNNILLSGGSAKAVLRYKSIIENKKSSTIGTKQFRKIAKHFDHGNPEERKKIEGILKDRFRLIPPALMVFSEICRFYGKDQVQVCRNGVREGYLVDYLEKNK